MKLPAIDFVHAKHIKDVLKKEQIPINEWVIIDQSGIGINYAFNTGKSVFVETKRWFKTEQKEYSFVEFEEWRNHIREVS